MVEIIIRGEVFQLNIETNPESEISWRCFNSQSPIQYCFSNKMLNYSSIWKLYKDKKMRTKNTRSNGFLFGKMKTISPTNCAFVCLPQFHRTENAVGICKSSIPTLSSAFLCWKLEESHVALVSLYLFSFRCFFLRCVLYPAFVRDTSISVYQVCICKCILPCMI